MYYIKKKTELRELSLKILVESNELMFLIVYRNYIKKNNKKKFEKNGEKMIEICALVVGLLFTLIITLFDLDQCIFILPLIKKIDF